MIFPPCALSGRVLSNRKMRYCHLKTPARTVSHATCRGCPHAGSTATALFPICGPALAEDAPECVRRGKQVRTDKVGCCGAEVVPIFGCEPHKECSVHVNPVPGVRSCIGCRDATSKAAAALPALTGPTHLAFHVYANPATRELWTAQLDAICEAFPRFDGLRLLSIACDDLADAEAVDCRGFDDVAVIVNDPQQWELPGFHWAMGVLEDHPGATIRLHAKGAARGCAELHLERWWKLGFAAMLDVPMVRKSLEKSIVTGCFRCNKPAVNLGVPWHYSGSFYAFRNDQIFAADWQPKSKAPATHYVEAWPALVAPHQLAGCLAYDGVGDLYQSKNWKESLDVTQITLPQSEPAAASFSVSPPPEVAIVIAGRNNGPFLAEAINSALQQSIPCEVVYADDCSTDDSLAVALDYTAAGLRVLPSSVHGGVCETRNRGALATSAPAIIFLDSDDRLPPDYAAQCLEVLTPATPFVYSATGAFGSLINHVWPPTPWSEYDLWRHNQVHTSALWARWAFEAAGRWQDDIPTMWDFDLAIRCARFGTPIPSTAVIGYRTHADSISVALNERDETACIPFKEMIRRKNARLGIAALISGRLPELFPRWLDALACAVRWALRFGELQIPPRLQLWLHGAATEQRAAFTAAAAKYVDTFAAVELRQIEFEFDAAQEMARREGTSTLLATYSAAVQSDPSLDVIWLVEDDILVPIQSCAQLFHELTAGANPPHGISGVYQNRHTEVVGKRMLGGYIDPTHADWRRYSEPATFDDTLRRVDFAGTGCFMFWSNRLATPRVWRTQPLPGMFAHDFCWGDDLRAKGGRLLMHGGVRCGHARTESEILYV